MDFTGNNVGKYIYEKVDNLTSELMSKKLLDKCTPQDKKRISIILNELKYDANRIKNSIIYR